MLDLFLSPAAYAEDQPHSHLILGTHVIHRGFNLGAMIGIGSSLAVHSYRKLNKSPSYTPSNLFSQTLTGAARGGMVGLGFGVLAVTGRMYSKDLIEWQDRSWRLLHHPTQNQTDHWSAFGAATGAIGGAMYNTTTPRALLGGAALGSSAAIVIMLAYRTMRGGKV